MTVSHIDRIADGAGTLAPARVALLLPVGWTIKDHPQDSLVGLSSVGGEVTGFSELIPPAASLAPNTVTGAAQTTDATPANVVAIPIATGQAARLAVGIHASVKSGPFATGALDLELRALVRNLSGSPALDRTNVGPNANGPGGTCITFATDDTGTLPTGALTPVVGSTDATAGALYGPGGTLDGQTLVLTVGGTLHTLTLSGTGNAASSGALLAAMQAQWPGLSATIVSTHLTLSCAGGSIVVGAGSANGPLGLTPGTYQTGISVLWTGTPGTFSVGVQGTDATQILWTVSVTYQLMQE